MDFGHPDDIHGIERKVLCTNLMTEKDDDDVRSGSDANLVDRRLRTTYDRNESVPSEPRTGGATSKGGKHQTGPKGLLNAYKDAKRNLSSVSNDEDERNVVATPSVSESTAGKLRKQMILAKVSDSDNESDEEDDEFLDEFRRRRMEQLKSIDRKRQQTTKERYGSVQDVEEVTTFLDLVDGTPPETLVVVHVYESFVPGCTAINRYMGTLAKRIPRILFVRMRGSLTSDTFDHIACPAINVYRDGALILSRVRITDEIGERPQIEDFCEYLERELPAGEEWGLNCDSGNKHNL